MKDLPLLLLSEIKNRPKKEKKCQILKTSESFSPLEIPSFPQKKKINVFKKSENELKQIRNFTKRIAKIEPISCSLQPKKMKLSELMNPNHVCEFENKKYIRMFHGTNSKHLTDILVNGLQLIGGGALGNGFYMTPSLVKAEQYNIKQQQKNCKLTPIVLELFLPMTTTVSAFPNIHDDANVYTEQNEFWQFVTKNESFLKKSICFNVFIYQ